MSAAASLRNLRRSTGTEEIYGPEMYYLRARYYSPQHARFLSPDPYWGTHNMLDDLLSMRQAANLYTYVLNNPIRYRDPSGLVARGSQEEKDMIAGFETKISQINASFKNSTPEDLGNNIYRITTTLTFRWSSLDFTYTINNGAIHFGMTDKYLGVILRNGQDTLAEAMIEAARGINPDYLSGRTIRGIAVELDGHFVFDNNGMTHMGGMDANLFGYDHNAWISENKATQLAHSVVNSSKEALYNPASAIAGLVVGNHVAKSDGIIEGAKKGLFTFAFLLFQRN